MSFTQNSNRMKTLNQIIRYTSQCSFQDDDWQMVLAYCRERYGGGKYTNRYLQYQNLPMTNLLSGLIPGSVPGILSVMGIRWVLLVIVHQKSQNS